MRHSIHEALASEPSVDQGANCCDAAQHTSGVCAGAIYEAEYELLCYAALQDISIGVAYGPEKEMPRHTLQYV